MGCSNNNELTKSYDKLKAVSKYEIEIDNKIMKNLESEQDNDIVKIEEERNDEEKMGSLSCDSDEGMKKEESVLIEQNLIDGLSKDYNEKTLGNRSSQDGSVNNKEQCVESKMIIPKKQIIPLMRHDTNNNEFPEDKKPPKLIQKNKIRENIDINDLLYNNNNDNINL